MSSLYLLLWERRWPSGQRAGIQIDRSVFEPWPGHSVVFLGKTLYSHSASLHPGEWVPAIAGGVTCDGLASHPGGIAIFLVALNVT